MAINKIGLMIVKAQVLNFSNEKLLNNLQEGVIIQQKDNNKLLF